LPTPTRFLRGPPAKPLPLANIENALQRILASNPAAKPTLRTPIAPRDLDSRLPLDDAVRVALLRRIGGEAARQVREQNPLDIVKNLASMMTGGPDRPALLMQVSTDASMRADRLRHEVGLGGPDSKSLNQVRHQSDAFIRAQGSLILKP